MSLRVLFFYGSVLPLCACSTVSEVLNEPTSRTSYHRSTDHEGNTVYRRQRIIHEGDDDDDSLVYSLVDLAQAVSTSTSSNSGMTLAQSNPGSVDLNLKENLSAANIHSAVSISLFSQKETMNMDIAYEFIGDVMSWDVGLAMISSDKTYLGFSTMARIQGPWKFSPYLGAGLYGGDSKTCQTKPLDDGFAEETCEKYFLFSITTEAGLRYIFNDHVQVRLGARYFTNTRQNDPLGRTLYGMNLGVLF